MNQDNARRGIFLMICTTVIFSVQDGLSRYLAGEYNVMMIVLIRYWFFGLFVVALSATRDGGVRRVAKTTQLPLQILRGVLLIADVGIMILAFVVFGLVASHTIFAVFPLLVAALSGPVLGEKVGWRRWVAIGVGFIGVLIILQPGSGVFSVKALLPLLAALIYAFYALLTRKVARKDSAETSFFWTGITGAVLITLIGPFFWEPLTGGDWVLMGALCLTGSIGHYVLIKTYEAAAPSLVQPFGFLQLLFVSLIGFTIFDETLDVWLGVGAVLVIGAGLFTLLRERANA